MFDHVRGDRLDQQTYPWISLTQAAIYLISPDDAERLRTIIFHDWARPFRRLFELIESGQLSVYEGWNAPHKRVPKEDFFGVPIRYPSYPDDRQEDIRRAYQPNFRAFIDCDLSWPRNRYFEARKSEPKYRELIIRSQELVALALEINGQTKSDKGQQDLRGMPKDMSEFYEPWPDYEWLAGPAVDDQPEERQRAARKSELVEKAIAGCFPEGIPESLPNKDLVQQIVKWVENYCKENGMKAPAISPTTILRAAGRKDKDA
jgi:hypothetical protein